jgi:hypothetical protein
MNMRHFTFSLIILLMLATLTVSCQSDPQAQLLKEAYRSKSTKLLYTFFDNWSEEVKSNEGEAQNPYVAEAHKVFAAFYQPQQIIARDIDCHVLYDEQPYFIVQSSLWKILQAETILYRQEEIDSLMIARIRRMYSDDTVEQQDWIKYVRDNHPNLCYESSDAIRQFELIATTTLDSAVEFRPPVHFEGKKVVYLTKKYEKMLNSFLGKRHIAFSEENIMQPAKSKGKSLSKHRFFNQAALIFYGHWGGYWQFETYPKANQIIFNPEMNRAVVLFRYVYEGGEAVLEKQNGEWVVVDSRFTWIE